jgi:hypothetical protein
VLTAQPGDEARFSVGQGRAWRATRHDRNVWKVAASPREGANAADDEPVPRPHGRHAGTDHLEVVGHPAEHVVRVSQHLPGTGDVEDAGAGGNQKPDPLCPTAHDLMLGPGGLKRNIIVLWAIGRARYR